MGSGKPIPRITALPAVPAMYSKLLAKAEEIFKDKKTRDYVKAQCSKRVRLMTCGTGSLTPAVRDQWRNATGNTSSPALNFWVLINISLMVSSET